MPAKNNGKFVKGMTPWNKGLRGYMGANRTSFTSERVEKERTKYALYTPHKPAKDGWVVCRTEERIPHKDKRTGKIYMHRCRRGYAQVVLEKHGIKIPKGHIVYHKDGDPNNNDINNLEVISRAVLLKRNNPKIKKGDNSGKN